MSSCHLTNCRKCSSCISLITNGIANEILLLGPRSPKQFDAILKKFRAPEAVQQELTAKYITFKSDTVLHVVHALADYISENILEPIELNQISFLSDFAKMMFDLKCSSDHYTLQKVEILGTHPTIKVCAKSSLGAYDITSLETAIAKSGWAGVSRQEIGGQYSEAYMDIETLIKNDSVFATPYRIWHRSIAPKFDPFLKRAAEEKGLIEKI